MKNNFYTSGLIAVLCLLASCKSEEPSEILDLSSLPLFNEHPIDTFTSDITVDLILGQWIDTASYNYTINGTPYLYTDIEYSFSLDSNRYTVTDNEIGFLYMTDGYWFYNDEDRTIYLNPENGIESMHHRMEVYFVTSEVLYATSFQESESIDQKITRLFIRP